MATVKLRNINPLGQVDLPLIRRQGGDYLGQEGIGNLEPGEEFEIDEKLAGRPPTPASGDPDGEDYVPGDPGEGLLAQVGNYELVTPASTTTDKPRINTKTKG